MLSVERRKRILGLAEENSALEVLKTARLLGVTGATIRRDLNRLAKEGLLLRTHGGAVLRREPTPELSLREIPYLAEKKRIAIAAANLIKEGDIIGLDSGSTTYELAKVIKGKQNITVVTNALNIAYELAHCRGITVNLTGGTADKSFYFLSGPLAEVTIDKVFVNKVFLGTSGLDIEKGFTDPYLYAAQIKQAMIKSAKEVIIITDSSKIGKIHFAAVSSITSIHKIITDSNISQEDLRAFREKGIEVILC